MKTPKEAARAIFGERAPRYTTSASYTNPQVLARLVQRSAPQPHWLALDVGTGTGHTAFSLASFVACVLGIDLTPEMLAKAKRLRINHALPNVVSCSRTHTICLLAMRRSISSRAAAQRTTSRISGKHCERCTGCFARAGGS